MLMKKLNIKSLSILLLVFVAGGLGIYLVFINYQDANTKPREKSDSAISQADKKVRITEDGFSPEEVKIKKGQSVVWVNENDDFRWPASNIHPTHEIYSAFDPLEPLAPGEIWVFSFEQVGEWRYHDHLKPNKMGTVTVTE